MIDTMEKADLILLLEDIAEYLSVTGDEAAGFESLWDRVEDALEIVKEGGLNV